MQNNTDGLTEYRFVVTDDHEGVRLDKAVTELADAFFSRTFIQKQIDEGRVYVNGACKKAGFKLTEGDVIDMSVPAPSECKIEPEDIPLDILYEDEDVIVVNKPKGMVVHPAAGHLSGTLVNALMYHCGDSLSGINGILRPGIVHRIDKDTSGSIIACKNDMAHTDIAAQLKDHSINRTYLAICCGILSEDELTIDAPIGRHQTDRKRMAIDKLHGKRAVTHVRVIKRMEEYNATFIECRLETGRTHQIRVHMESLGYPLLGDEVYYRGRECKGAIKGIDTAGQALHAYKLGFMHPRTHEYIETVAPIPEYMQKITRTLE